MHPKNLLLEGRRGGRGCYPRSSKSRWIVQPSGLGMVIAFTADPNYRSYLDGMNVLFLNAVFRGPAHVRPPGAEDME